MPPRATLGIARGLPKGEVAIECATSALDQPQMLTAALLSEIAGQVAGRPSLAVTEWQWRPLHGGVSLTTGFTVFGARAATGTVSNSCVRVPHQANSLAKFGVRLLNASTCLQPRSARCRLRFSTSSKSGAIELRYFLPQSTAPNLVRPRISSIYAAILQEAL